MARALSSDDSRRSGVNIPVQFGAGLYVSFRCPKCNLPRATDGRKLQRFQGLKQYICKHCA